MARILKNAASAVTTATSSVVSTATTSAVNTLSPPVTQTIAFKFNPFDAADDVISKNIIGIHDAQAARQDVDSLYSVVSNIVKSSASIGSSSIDLKQVKSIDLVEDKVPQSGFKPSYTLLKEIACQMTCHSFNTTNAHESVVGVLEKLKSYTWDTKAVIALSAFSLDFGETWRLSLVQTKKELSAFELHVFKLEDEPVDAKTTTKENNADLISALVDRTLQLIDGIIKLEKLIANKNYTNKDVPTLFKAPRDLYTYWVILALIASANQLSQLDWKVKNEIVARVKVVLSQLNADLEQIKLEIDALEDITWRLTVFQTPSGILELLRALILPKDIKQLDIFDGTTKQLVNLVELKTQNLFLFISGLDNIEDEITSLKPIHDSITKDKDRKDYKILWVPVVENWTNEAKEKFERLKSLIPWYVVQYLSPIKGYKPLTEEWGYNGKPIVVATNARGEVINKNALHLILVWGISAFPFRPEDEVRVSQNGNWLWSEIIKIYPDVQPALRNPNTIVFFYGGTDITVTEKYETLLEKIKKDSVTSQTDTSIVTINLSKVDITTQNKFWLNITNSFLSKIQKPDFNLDSTLKDIQTLLSMKTESGWSLVSKGENVITIGYNEVITTVLETFDTWKITVSDVGFESAFKEKYEDTVTSVAVHCVHFELNNIRSGVPTNVTCPNPSCGLNMEVQSVNYKCCHGAVHKDQATANGEVITLKGPIAIPK
ncbi:hypothetical protein PIB30_032114 [Stylosanthes scabra]|uniref:Uncharacterized protein n=1 Tax=Stylosanthes scabra TaxID=79078 RepID=A0ABU6UBG7_9FABA|nr:hypothetical protein [Stylosanthes scabra]